MEVSLSPRVDVLNVGHVGVFRVSKNGGWRI